VIQLLEMIASVVSVACVWQQVLPSNEREHFPLLRFLITCCLPNWNIMTGTDS
jgi:hypothetical protein